MLMKKAVTLIKGILKLPKLRKKDGTKDDNFEGKCARKPKLPDYTVFRPCERCAVVYDSSIWTTLQGKLLLQNYSELADSETDYIEALQCQPSQYEEHDSQIESDKRIRDFFHHFGLLNPQTRQDLPMCCNKSCMSTSCLRSHTFRCVQAKNFKDVEISLGPHFPTFIMVNKCKQKLPELLLYEDRDVILFRSSLSVFRSLLEYYHLPHELTVNMSAEVWVVVSKIQIGGVSLGIEEDLVFEYIDCLIWTVFFDVPKSRDVREMHLEALYQAVDKIMDISLYITRTSGIPPENQNYIKETIIETATVVTSTAAESTATVGIETAAMAMGQAAAGVALSVLVDVGITAGMVTRAKIRRDKGIISQKEFQKTVRCKLCDSGCQFLGGTAGTIVGQVLIPVPVVGAIVGGFCGSLIGAGVSKGIIKTSEIIAKSQASKFKAITEK